jgi:hypothetical protein
MNLDIQFAPCSLTEVRDYVVQNHYSHSCPKNGLVSHAFSAKVDDILVGASVFGHKAGNAKTGSIFKEPYNTSDDCRELIRLVMDDVMPKNSESQFIGWCLRYLRSNSDILGLLSYADPEHDHNGTIYRASNWLYTGMSHPSKKFIVDGLEMHQRSATTAFGTASVPAIKAMGHTVELRTAKPKHRYIYVLQKCMLPFVKYKIVPFVAMILLTLFIGIGSGASCAKRVYRRFAFSRSRKRRVA